MTTDPKTTKPRRARDKRVQLTIRIDPDLLASLEAAAEDRMVAKDLIIAKAIETFLERFVPAALALEEPTAYTGAGRSGGFQDPRPTSESVG